MKKISKTHRLNIQDKLDLAMNSNTQIKQIELKWNLRINIQEEEEEEDAWVGLGWVGWTKNTQPHTLLRAVRLVPSFLRKLVSSRPDTRLNLLSDNSVFIFP